MTDADGHSRAKLRWYAYWLLITLAAGNAAGRILAVNSVNRFRAPSETEKKVQDELAKSRAKYETEDLTAERLADRLQRRETELRKRLRRQRPFLSGNDRSRWCTVRALVEDGTYAIDQFVTDPDERSIWDTIDMVKHDQTGEPHLYSSKPTLLPTILAGEYWLLRKATGLSLDEHPFSVVRIILLTINVPALIVIVLVTARLAERFGETDWGCLFVVAAAAFGTFLNTFVVVLNNHLIAAASAAVALYAAIRIWYDDELRLKYFVVAGFFAAFTAANELPALTFFGLLGLALLCKAPKQTLVAGVPAALVVVVAALGTNYAAHRTLVPPYAHRAAGKDWQTGNWYNYTYKVGSREIASYWKRDEESIQRRSAIDRGEPSVARYATHCLVGHHGIFSLTPMWLLSVIGIFMFLRDKGSPSLKWLGVLILAATLICLAFYLFQGAENRNYGGTSSGLRWMFWFAPLWLVAMLPAADATAERRWQRVVAGLLLALSVLSASYPTWNPWTHPWLARWMAYLEWIEL